MSDRPSSFVYAFTMRLPGTDHAYTKIGVTIDPERRFYEINKSVPGILSVDFIVRGDEQREAILHGLCSHAAIGNEWFWPIDLTLINQLLAAEIEEMKSLFPSMKWWSDRYKNGHYNEVFEATWVRARENGQQECKGARV